MFKVFLIILILSITQAAFASAESMEKLQQQINVLSDEVIKLKNKSDGLSVEKSDIRYSGQLMDSNAGSNKVYKVNEGISIGGYGEIVYQDEQSGSASTDAYRFVPYIGYKFTDKIILNAEIEIEHVNEIYLEFAYLDFLHNDMINFRLGHLLVPIGLVNLYHEPVFFNSVYRPEIERNIIPSTWHENGIEMHGKFDNFKYRLGVVNSLDLSSTDPAAYKNSSWIRSGRQKASKAKAEDLSYFARLDYEFNDGNVVGLSYYTGESRQDNKAIKAARVDLGEAHVNYRVSNFRFMGMYALGSLSDTWAIAGDLGKKVEGYYADFSYDVGTQFGYMPVNVFARYSKYNLHKEVVSSITKDLSLEREVTTVGVNFKPHNQVILKVDYQIRENKLENEDNNFNLGIGFVF